MKVIHEGHVYELQNYESEGSQQLSFIQKAPASPDSEEMEVVREGTTNEEVLSMLIDRLNNLNSQFPCRENSIVITKLEESLMWLNKRAMDREARGVLGKHIK